MEPATLSAGWLTPVALATHQIALNYASLTYMVPLGVSAAAAVSVGHAVGAGDPERARRAGWLALGLGTGFMLLAAVVFLVAPGPLIALYTRDPQVMAVGPSLLGLAAASRSLTAFRPSPPARCADWARREYPCWLIWWATGC